MFGFFENEQAKKIKGHLLQPRGPGQSRRPHRRPRNGFYYHGRQEEWNGGHRGTQSCGRRHQRHSSDLPTTDSDRFDQIFDLVDMMLSDGIVDENEMDFCIMMAEKLGFRKAIVGVLVRKISQGVKDGLPEDRIKEESLSFLNY
ncbi:MAG: TerB family tellurite resistance protein [Hymenobacter sp.]